jgi:ATPase subunit of ABC transporter with duplicated ATPase domains
VHNREPAQTARVLAKENPFASSQIEKLEFRFPPGVNWEVLLKRLEAQQWCASIVGGNGSGKTTLLEQLAPHLEARGFEPVFFRLNSESSMRDKERLSDTLRAVRKPGFILLDGAEQLSTRHWLSVRGAASQAAGFVVTVHRSSRLPVVLELETNAALLDDLVSELTGGKLPDHEAGGILHRHRGNVREALRELYDRWAG